MNQLCFYLLLALTLTTCQNVKVNLGIKKCCQQNEVIGNVTGSCVPKKRDEPFKDKSLVPKKLLDRNSNETSVFIKHVKMPNCKILLTNNYLNLVNDVTQLG